MEQEPNYPKNGYCADNKIARWTTQGNSSVANLFPFTTTLVATTVVLTHFAVDVGRSQVVLEVKEIKVLLKSRNTVTKTYALYDSCCN